MAKTENSTSRLIPSGRVEASLRTKFNPKNVIVAQENHLADHIGRDTSIITTSTMDPFGLGPTTMSYYALFGGELYAWVWEEWDMLIDKINALRKSTKAKLLVGGPGVWEFTIMREQMDRYGIDYVFQGESDDVAVLLFEQIEADSIDPGMFFRGYSGYYEKFRKTFMKDGSCIGAPHSFPIQR